MTLDDLSDALGARAQNADEGLSNDAIDFRLEQEAPGLPALRQAAGGLFGGRPLSPWVLGTLSVWLSDALQVPRADVLAAELPDVVAMIARARA